MSSLHRSKFFAYDGSIPKFIITDPNSKNFGLISLTKLMVSRDLPRSTATKQIAFNQRDLHSTPLFERAIDRHC